MSNTFANGLAVFVLTTTPRSPDDEPWDEVADMVVLASDAREARQLAYKAARRDRPSKERADRWLDPQRSTCRRQSAGHPHVLLAVRLES